MNLTKITEEEYAQVEAHILSKLPTENTREKFDPLLHAYKVWLLEYLGEGGSTPNFSLDEEFAVEYDVAKGIIRALRPEYSQNTLTHFCIDILPFEKNEFFNETGIFLSAFIKLACEKTGEKEYFLDISLFTTLLDFIGMENRADLTLDGNVGNYLGKNMQEGKIVVKGNTEECAGEHVYDGEIIIHGNAKSNLGHTLCGGTIRVKGDAGIDVGLDMCAGEIYLDGTYTNLADARIRGTIYHKNQIIWRQI